MEALGINLGYLIIQILGITILILLMKGWAYEPVLNLLEERKARIAKGLEDARQAAIARDNADVEAKKILDAARTEAAKIRTEAATQAEASASGIVSKANEEAKKIVASARDDAEAERNRILSDLRGQVVGIAMAAANKVVGATLDEQRQHKLIGDFFAALPASVSRMSGARAEVTSALPLTDGEKAAAQSAINAQQVVFKVDPSILGGLIVRVGDQVVDDSVAGKMSGMRDVLA
ncbi:MAG: F0F1 ATP synthase subunit B [Anaerolineales bacterium]|nr:F0F1 ATP synthase subunit B [Anaerolineales bacterium]MCB8954588.1 F0F1 ATP synthase subunit B [Ardenticatenales bacterium]